MLKNLFSSETRILLLSQFLMHPDTEYYLRQISTKYGLSPRLVSLELKNLEKIDLIKKRISGKQHYFTVNTQHQLFRDLQNMFLKTVGLKDVLKKYIESFATEIKFAFIYGSVAKGSSTAKSDVDLMIIGNISTLKISGFMIQAGTELGREINFSIFPLAEFKTRLQNNDHFISTIINEPKIFLTGDQDEFGRLVKK